MSRRPRRNHTPAFKVSFGVQNCPPAQGPERAKRDRSPSSARNATAPNRRRCAGCEPALLRSMAAGIARSSHNPAMMMFGPNQHRPTNEFASSTN
jgi:hypothetical protein